MVLAPLHPGFTAESRITPDARPCLGKVAAELAHNAFELFEGTRRGVMIRGPQPGAKKRLATEDVQWQKTGATVVAMKEPPLHCVFMAAFFLVWPKRSIA